MIPVYEKSVSKHFFPVIEKGWELNCNTFFKYVRLIEKYAVFSATNMW